MLLLLSCLISFGGSNGLSSDVSDLRVIKHAQIDLPRNSSCPSKLCYPEELSGQSSFMLCPAMNTAVLSEACGLDSAVSSRTF
jgi:hypothetical protein